MSEIDKDWEKLNTLLNGSGKLFNSSTISAVAKLLEQRDLIIQRWQSSSSPEDKEVAIDFLRFYNRDLKMILGL